MLVTQVRGVGDSRAEGPGRSKSSTHPTTRGSDGMAHPSQHFQTGPGIIEMHLHGYGWAAALTETETLRAVEEGSPPSSPFAHYVVLDLSGSVLRTTTYDVDAILSCSSRFVGGSCPGFRPLPTYSRCAAWRGMGDGACWSSNRAPAILALAPAPASPSHPLSSPDR